MHTIWGIFFFVGQKLQVWQRLLKRLSDVSCGATSLLELKPFLKTFDKNGFSGNFVIIFIRFVRRNNIFTVSAPQ